jgi:regulator of protease activity HflC (stomatin/prohibitin superfamily)
MRCKKASVTVPPRSIPFAEERLPIMAEVRRFPFVRHIRAVPSSHVLHYRGETVLHSGRGLALWVWPLNESIAEVPVDDRDLLLAVHGRTSDYQDVTVQGVVTYRVNEPERLARRVDFAIDLRSGQYLREPITRIEALLSQLAQEEVLRYLARSPIREVLTDGIARVREAIDAALARAPQLPEFGLTVTAVRMTGIRPNPDLEKAIEAPQRERIKQESDEAAFGRRALAVEKERAIAENEMQNRIELAKREEHLVEQEGANARRKAVDVAATVQITADAEAKRIETVDGAHKKIEREWLTALQDAPAPVLATLAAQAFAANIDHIDNLQITPDLLNAVLARFSSGAAGAN